jgi:Mrp family chromosome partitioning ATPase
LVDGVVMVIAAEQTSSDAVATALRESPGIRERIVSVALNRAPDEFGRYYHRPDRKTKRITAQSTVSDNHHGE